MIGVIQLIAIFAVPVFILRYSNWFITRWFGTIGTAYLLGIVVAVVIFLLNKLGLGLTLNTDVGEIGSHLAISIAIPLLLFSTNLREVKKLSSTVLKSGASLIVSALIVTTIVYLVYAKGIENGKELSGMAIGLYTGGTPNLNAIGKMFQLNSTIIGVANLSDMMIGAVFYVFLLVGCKPLLSKILPNNKAIYLNKNSDITNTDDLDLKHFKVTKVLIRRVMLGFSIAVIGAGLGILVWVIMGMQDGTMIDLLVPSMMITVTVLGVAFSFNKKIRETKGMNVTGQYFILVFSFALASSFDFTKMQDVFLNILILYGSITIGVFILHVTISKFLKIDPDCTMVTLTAGLYGPAFIPAITKQIKNDELTVPGLITGSIGYAIGTFLGALMILAF